MPEPHPDQTPPRRVGVYERLGRTGGSPGKTIGIAVVALIFLIAIIIALAW
jgi:flagellar biogenesis protein FliO